MTSVAVSQPADARSYWDGLKLDVRRGSGWKLFGVVLGLSLIGALLKVPFGIALFAPDAPQDWPLIAVLYTLETFITLGLIPAAFGVPLSIRIGLGMPFIEGWIARRPIWKQFGRVAVITTVVTVVTTLALVGVLFGMRDLVVNELAASGFTLEDLEALPSAPILLMIPASFAAGITEEIAFRLGLLSLLLWLGRLIRRDAEGRPTRAVFWAANLLIALAFGALHFLNITAFGLPLSPWLVLRTLLGNALAAVAFGWLYWRYGLESAIMSHALTDILLHVVLRAVLGAVS